MTYDGEQAARQIASEASGNVAAWLRALERTYPVQFAEWLTRAKADAFEEGVQSEKNREPLSKIEILLVRDPDSYTSVHVFVDGVETNDYVENTVDAGAGHMRSDWVAQTRAIAGDERLTPQYRAAVVAARQDPPCSRYIEDDRTPPRDVAWDLHKDDELLQLWEDYPNLAEADKDRLDSFACEQVSRMFVAELIEGGWDAWLMHGTDPDSVDGLVGDHYWVAVDDEGMVANYDLTYKQFGNVADPQVALAVDGAAGEWPLQWHTYPETAAWRHEVVPYRTVKPVLD